MIEERLGKARTAALADEADNPTAFYVMALREMGTSEGGQLIKNKLPSAPWAWLEIYRQRKESEPTFSHIMVANTVEFFGGWAKMWEDFSNKKFEKSRELFIFRYKKIIDNT
jgi:hypothetical protein